MKSESIVNMVINVEKQGEIFYKKLSEIADEKFKDILVELSKEEKEHAEIFSNLRKAENWDEIDSYILTYASYNIIPDLESIILELEKMDLDTIFDLAIGIEKDSIILYYELKDKLTDSEAKELLKKIIEQEKLHIKKIIEMKKNL